MINLTKKGIKTTSFYALLAILMWITFLSIHIWSFGFTDHSQPSDCVIVLGASVSGKSPSPVFKERIEHAISLYQQGIVSKIVFTGGVGDGKKFSEAAVAEKYALEKGIPASSILIEEQSKTTRQNLVEAQSLMIQYNLTSAVIVSDPLHLRRASAIAHSLDLNAVTSPTPTSQYRSTRTRVGFLAREVYFLHHFWIFRQ